MNIKDASFGKEQRNGLPPPCSSARLLWVLVHPEPYGCWTRSVLLMNHYPWEQEVPPVPPAAAPEGCCSLLGTDFPWLTRGGHALLCSLRAPRVLLWLSQECAWLGARS